MKENKRIVFSLLIAVLGFAFSAQAEYGLVDKIVVSNNSTEKMRFVHDQTMYREGWDTLSQPIFWRQVIRMSSDTCLVNIASCRKPIDRISKSSWANLTEDQKKSFKDSVCLEWCLESGTSIYITAGKGEFYEIRKVMPEISKAITVFERNQVDPWYAQAIMLIESPGKTKTKSYVGANGPFQLMRSVAIKYGLRVNKYVDERSNLEKSALAASRFIKAVCVAQVKDMLNAQGLTYTETDLWFRLLVLHAYHAGPGNVRCVISSLNPKEGGVELLRKVWQTECRGFKNESQNYSQIALATLLQFDQLLMQDGDTVFVVQGDKYFHRYDRNKMKPTEAYDYLNMCLSHYEEDLVEGVLPYADFMKRITRLRKEYTLLAKSVTNGMDVVLNQYPATSEHINKLAYTLTKKQRYDDAIALLKLNVEMHPTSVAAHDSLARAYYVSGNRQMAELYSSKSLALSKKVN